MTKLFTFVIIKTTTIMAPPPFCKLTFINKAQAEAQKAFEYWEGHKITDIIIHLEFDLRFCFNGIQTRDVEAEAEAGSRSGTFSVEAEARKIHRFRFHIGGKNGERKEIGSAILRRRTNRGSINIKK